MFKIKEVLLILFVLIAGISTSQTLKVGAAKRVITPDPLLPVSGGMGPTHAVTENQGDLFARAMVFEKGDERIAIVGLDFIGWPAYLGDKSRELIKGIPAENVLIGVTHTHSGPDTYGLPDENGNISADFKYLEWCVQQIAEVVNEALENVQPADLKIAVDEAKGKIAFNYYAERLYDPRCGVIQAIGKDGKTIATLVNYATHPEIIGPKRGILSPDMCGPLYDRIEDKAGGIAVFMNSAQGGMVTADNRLEGGKWASDYAECTRNGYLLADEALRIVNSVPVQKNPDIFCASKDIEFPVSNPMMQAALKKSPIASAGGKENVVTTKLNLLNIGTAQVLTVPGEALPNIGYYVKRNMNTEHPFLLGMTNDAYGYIIAKVDFDSFERYEYICRTSLGEMTGEVYIKEALDLVNSNPKPKQ